MNEIQRAYLEQFLSTLSEAKKAQYQSFSADYFCADEINANICSELIISGEKTATCSMKYCYDQGLEPMPIVGHLQVVTDWHGQPKSIIEITEVSECQFSEVSAEFAKEEGEGDQSLMWWRKTHWEFFSEECAELGLVPSQDMLLVLERFKLVYV